MNESPSLEIENLLKELRSPDKYARAKAILRLREIECRDPRAITRLKTMAQFDSDRVVNNEAALTLNMLGYPWPPPLATPTYHPAEARPISWLGRRALGCSAILFLVGVISFLAPFSGSQLRIAESLNKDLGIGWPISSLLFILAAIVVGVIGYRDFFGK